VEEEMNLYYIMNKLLNNNVRIAFDSLGLFAMKEF